MDGVKNIVNSGVKKGVRLTCVRKLIEPVEHHLDDVVAGPVPLRGEAHFAASYDTC